MKNSTYDGFDQHYNVQAVVDQASLLSVATALSNDPNDKQEAELAVNAIASEIGKPAAAALDNGYWSPANAKALEDRGIDPYIATGREPHHHSWNGGTGDWSHQGSGGLSAVLVTRVECRRGRMVSGLLGVQLHALSRVDGRPKVGVVFTRLHDKRKPAEAQVIKEIWLSRVGENSFGAPLRQTASDSI